MAMEEGDETSSDSLVKPPTKKAKRGEKQKVPLFCEWSKCDFTTLVVADFIRHVTYHLPDLEVREKDDDPNQEFYVCLWKMCSFETCDSEEVKRHLNFHSYHTRIKSLGKHLIESTPDINSCMCDTNMKNEIPDLPDPFVCSWDSCYQEFTNPQLFFDHVYLHLQSLRVSNSNTENIYCLWTSCQLHFRHVYRLADHIRTHTHEKTYACHSCGATFASGTKLIDHVRRQITTNEQSYQCSHCSKYFSSERLLRNHMRNHVNHYKCTFCDMTCPKPSALSLHIRYKHLQDKPFECNRCPYKAKTRHDLDTHMISHAPEPLFECDKRGCTFKCRSSYGLNKHLSKIHGEDDPEYCCHMCDDRFHRGAHLTHHLYNIHDIRWPNGHCRFRYKMNEDGLYHLETVRYEILETTEAVETPPEVILDRSRRVLISIAELDERGNVVGANEVEAEQVTSLPAGEATALQEGSYFSFK